MNNRDRDVIKRAAWLSMPRVARVGAWPIIAMFLPLLIDIIVAWLKSRQDRDGVNAVAMSMQDAASAVDPDIAANVDRAERETR